jgi:DNA repair protein RecO (recombination protein O)
MTHKTKGIVLRTIKYGETSLVVTIFTELFGVQTYMVSGVRTHKKSGHKAAMFQPAAMLEMEVYQNNLSNLQRIKEYNWCYLYQSILTDVIKNSIALFMVELLQKTLKQPEEHIELFHFCEDAFIQLDHAENTVAANFAPFFTLQLPQFFGFRFNNNYSMENNYLDLIDGNFIAEPPHHSSFLDQTLSGLTSELLKIMQPEELSQLKLNKETRRSLLLKYLEYYRIHISDFGHTRSLDILQEVLG